MSHVKLATQRQATGAQQLGVRLTALPGMHETPTAGRQGNLRGGVETPRSRTSSCLGKASPPGLPAHCSLHSSAASSPPGLRWVWTAACSYSTHRLPSESSEAGGPVGARVWGTPFGGGVSQAPPAGRSGHQAVCHQPLEAAPWPATWPGFTHLWVSASGWGRARPDSWLSWWEGGWATRPPRRQLRPGPGSGQQPAGLAPASGQSQAVTRWLGGPPRPSPGEGVRDSLFSERHGRTGPRPGSRGRSARTLWRGAAPRRAAGLWRLCRRT